jgi:hypothetical protein
LVEKHFSAPHATLHGFLSASLAAGFSGIFACKHAKISGVNHWHAIDCENKVGDIEKRTTFSSRENDFSLDFPTGAKPYQTLAKNAVSRR